MTVYKLLYTIDYLNDSKGNPVDEELFSKIFTFQRWDSGYKMIKHGLLFSFCNDFDNIRFDSTKKVPSLSYEFEDGLNRTLRVEMILREVEE